MASGADEQAAPKFPWDFDVPDNPFWDGLEFTVARNFLTCYKPHELEHVEFDATLAVPDRLQVLLSRLHARLADRIATAAPEKLHIADPSDWQNLMLAIETMHKYLGQPDEEAETMRTMLATTKGDNRVPWLNMFADLELRNGNFAEAENLAREVLPWMQTHQQLGVDSPQAFGTTRTIIRSMWKQGGSKQTDARRAIQDTSALIDGMQGGKFAKYQAEERQLLADLVAELEGGVP